MTTLVFLHSPGQSPFDWREVADYLPPAWAIAAPDLRQCHTVDELCSIIDRDAMSVSDERIILISSGSSAIALAAFNERYAHRVEGLIAIKPRWKVSMRQRFTERKKPFLAVLRKTQIVKPADITELSHEDTQYPAQCAAALYRVITK
ncbi:alpha/beta fold hydrolase [Arcanobacterium phocae]|uniref:Alpha/beta hydrolase family protein n=1 Tax=Arcanobacterium phocae TaxID=131112 RepID=A0A1H2LD85_9ACTO|nr:hypothetical protein [Arcanobacterium phocae]SDU78967.1 hypothetical protein SAMN04489737_0688 [Arcanobacterium phocae]